MTTFLIGLMVGSSLGIFVGGLMAAASRSDDESEAYIRRISHVCTERCRPLMERHIDEYGRRVI